MKHRVSAEFVALGLFAACEAAAQNAAAPPAPLSGFRLTQLFSQFNFYDTDSDRDQLRFRYRAYGFSTGGSFAWGRTVTGHVFGGYMNAADRVSSSPQSKTF
jgi:hypothetical protein